MQQLEFYSWSLSEIEAAVHGYPESPLKDAELVVPADLKYFRLPSLLEARDRKATFRYFCAVDLAAKPALLVGVAEIQQSAHEVSVMWLPYLSVVPARKNQGVGKSLARAAVAALSGTGRTLEPSRFTAEGYQHLRPTLISLCEEMAVPLRINRCMFGQEELA